MMRQDVIDELGLDADDPEVIAKFERDEATCNCDLDDQCFNLTCREENDRQRRYWAQYWTPAMIEAYRPEYDPNYSHNDCGLMCPHPRKY